MIWFGSVFDVTEQVEVETALNEALIEHQATLDAIPEQLIEIDEAGHISNAHARDGTILGRGASELVGRRLMDIVSEDVAYPFTRAIREALADGISSTYEVAFEQAGRTEHRSLTVVKKQSTSQQDALATGTLFIVSLSDITERKLAEDRVRQLVNHDELTQLLNRRGFQEQLRFVHEQACRHHTFYAVLFIDIDHFKHLNDSLGHQVGDLALTHVAGRLTQNTRASDVVARLGGDEFVVLLLGSTEDSLAEEARQVAIKLIAEVSRPLSLANTPFNLTCSVGIALSDTTTPDSQEVLRWADLAMYSAKESGRNGIKFFDDRIQQVMLHRVRIEQDLRVALSNKSLELHAQPIVDERGTTLGHEVLLRWNRPGLGPVSPVEFIPVAEQTGLIVPIGQWVLEMACQRLVRWASDPLREHLFLAVNISAMQIKQADFVERLRHTIVSTGAPAHLLKLELTESLLHEDVEATIKKLHELRALGVRLSLDDFGTGYSSLAYLRKLPIQELKIDRSFVLHALDVPDDAAVARTIVQLAQTLRLDVVAEGVETQEQLIFLRGIGCQKFQGYMFGKPGPLDHETVR